MEVTYSHWYLKCVGATLEKQNEHTPGSTGRCIPISQPAWVQLVNKTEPTYESSHLRTLLVE